MSCVCPPLWQIGFVSSSYIVAYYFFVRLILFVFFRARPQKQEMKAPTRTTSIRAQNTGKTVPSIDMSSVKVESPLDNSSKDEKPQKVESSVSSVKKESKITIDEEKEKKEEKKDEEKDITIPKRTINITKREKPSDEKKKDSESKIIEKKKVKEDTEEKEKEKKILTKDTIIRKDKPLFSRRTVE